MTTETELDNPTEWGGIIGTALLHPERRDEMERRAELKIACSHAAFCQCGDPLDQATAFLLKIDGRAAGVLCKSCFDETLRGIFDRATAETPPDTVRRNIRNSITARTWHRDFTGEAILARIDTYPTPRKKSAQKKLPAAFSPQEISGELIGASSEVWSFPYMVLRPSSQAQEKLTGKRVKNSIVNIKRGLDFLRTTKHGAELFQAPEVEGIVTLTDTAQLRTYSADARKLRTCERNTAPGGKWHAPIGENSALVYRVAGENVAVLMPMK